MTRLRLVAAATVAAVLLAACGDGDSDSVATTAAAAGTAAGATNAATAGTTIDAFETSLGEVLVDGEGMTLYLFTNDSPGTSVCEGDCATVWPPLTATGDPLAGEGVDASKLGTTSREDGTTQITYGGLPLYRYANDTAPGQTNGQGIGGVWYVALAEGAVPGY